MAKSGKGARTKRKMRRAAEKRAKKNALKALYEGYRKSGENTKGSRTARRKKANAALNFSLVSHPNGDCGNVGCSRCFGVMLGRDLKRAKSFRGIFR